MRARRRRPGDSGGVAAQIFEPFFTTRPGGTGLGLYIARELADANGAALELLPKGPGAHFRMTLKRATGQSVGTIKGKEEYRYMTRRIRDRGQPKVLVVDDEPDLLELLELTLSRMGLDTTRAQTVERGDQAARHAGLRPLPHRHAPPDGEGLAVVEHITEKGLDVPVAVITAFGSAENAVAALKAGAFDYLAKPVALEQLRALVKQALKVPEKPAAPSSYQLLGESQAIMQVRTMIERLSKSQAPVFITGESGSGKELAARMIHSGGSRAELPFVPVNCGAIPENLMESEFFGYKKGGVHRGGRRPRRFFPGRQRRYAVPGRSRRPAAADAGKAAARDPGKESAQSRRHDRGAGRRTHHQRDAQAACRRWSTQESSARIFFTACT